MCIRDSFYTSITFNPLEIANNMKKSGGFIPGIRPGRPTVEYLQKILNYIIFIGACGLIIVQVIPVSYTHLQLGEVISSLARGRSWSLTRYYRV